MKIDVSRRDVGRLVALVRDRRKRLQKGVGKFSGESWDAELGQNMVDSLAAYTSLERSLKEAMKHEDDHPCGAGCDPRQYEGRRDAPGDYRPAG